MSQLGPDPGATRKPPSWLVFEAGDPWLEFGVGFEMSDFDRSYELGRTFMPRTNGIVNDKQLEQRYKAAGIEHLFFLYSVTDPGGRQRSRITRYGDRASGTGSFPDDPARPLGEDFDAWLAARVRAALESYRRLPPPSQA
ncbi:hypothetical protein EAS64_14980 [Trebonia kvetii]|uniref:Uncharacterized protein n=1 Tax=Trebonia kvetii TaxID=2480626 RepID=A0A6P2BZV9_9ACTN|nr:hypothetical protein [Trebonia kvetii]TVZ03766.1 hypothetical protein EAS64_14980 [Trebonia kvetii]